MSTPCTRLPQRPLVLDVDGQTLTCDSPEFEEAIAQVYGRRRRPRCLCRTEGVEMYVARLGERYVVKRMPETGSQHSPDCPSFEPPAALSGLREVLGGAIKEDPSTGFTTLKLDFSLSKRPARAFQGQPVPQPFVASSSVSKLSLRALLHYLWDQAGLTRWQPGFDGRRTWGAVRHQLLQSAEHKLICAEPLASRIYVPEPFMVEQRDAIIARRTASWAKATGLCDGRQRLLLLIAEVKEIGPARHGHKAVIKHMPDLAFTLDDSLYHQLAQRFEPELALWSASDFVHMVMIATVSISAAGLPSVAQLCIMPVTAQWLPVETIAELQLLDKLVGQQRAFCKILRYNLRADTRIACLALTDSGDPAQMLYADEGVEPAAQSPAEK